MSRLWMLWPPYRRRMRAIDRWCEDHREQVTQFARQVAQLGVPASSIRWPKAN